MVLQDTVILADTASDFNVLSIAVSPPKLLIVVDQREFIRGCLVSWLRSFAHEFEVAGVADATLASYDGLLSRASAVLFGASARMHPNAWMADQVGWVRANRADLPIIAVIDTDEAHVAETPAARLPLQGYIPTSSSLEVAGAALRLVVAGGMYMPRTLDGAGPSAPLSNGRMASDGEPAPVARLTPRERAVLDLLERGMANKIIAYRLGMSQSTVKAHVHNIISKLRVRNRTEAAVSARYI